jgi:hypothetical protein
LAFWRTASVAAAAVAEPATASAATATAAPANGYYRVTADREN